MFHIYGGLGEDLNIKCYTNSHLQTCVDDSKSQYGVVFTMNGGHFLEEHHEKCGFTIYYRIIIHF